MKLPTFEHPTFEITVPSTETVIRARPFLVKEEKILLMAQQSDNDRDIIFAIKQILDNCVVSEGFTSNDLTTFDLEYLFIKLRAQSVNNIIDVSYRDNEDDKQYDFKIDLDDVIVKRTKEMDRKIQLSNNVGVVMQYPSINVVEAAPELAGANEIVDYTIRSCIKQVFDEDSVYELKDFSVAEVTEFLDSLDVVSYEKIRAFVESIPTVYYKIEYTNSMGNKRTIELESLRDFFTWG
jgi:hypothetical protein